MRVVVAAAIRRDGQLLVAQRSHPAALAGLWELPGGKVKADEVETEALVRECREEMGIDVTVEERLGDDVPIRDGWILHVYAGRILRGEPQPLEHLDLRWVAADDLAGLDWLPVNAVLVPRLVELLAID